MKIYVIINCSSLSFVLQKGSAMFSKLFKIIFLAALIFASVIAYESYTGKNVASIIDQKTKITQQTKPSSTPKGNSSEQINSKQQVTTGPSLEERPLTKHEKSALKALFLQVMPEQSTWPVPLQKMYRAVNMEDVIEPLRQSPNWVKLSNISRDVPQAVIAIEDHNFYNHGAIAAESILRAFLVNVSAGEVVQGGSTLTQQLVKNVFLSPEQTMGRKVEEIILSLILEEQYTKDEILEMYLNTTYLGAGATGIKEAARKYFDKAPSNLELAEAAIIAALPYAPSALNPLENPVGCRKRQQLVLQEMQKYGFISQTQYAEAKAKLVQLTNGKKL